MKKGSRKIILGLLAFFLLLVGMYVYHMNTLREGTIVSHAGSLIGGTRGTAEAKEKIINKNSNVTEGSVTISGRDALNQMWDAMSQLEPEYNLLDWGRINFSEIKTLENWGKGGEYQIYDQDGNVMTKYSERLNPTTSQTEFMFSDPELRKAQIEYYRATGKEVKIEGMNRINELRELYPDMPVDLLFYIQEVEEMNGWTQLSERNLEGFMETINMFGPERGTELVRQSLEAEVTLSKPWETNVLNTNETTTVGETGGGVDWNTEVETGPVSINEEPGLILGD